MKANEFFKKVGIDAVRSYLAAYEDTLTDDLKRLVESHDLIESCGGLQSVKDTFDFAWSHGADELTEYGERLKQAILDVESCQ